MISVSQPLIDWLNDNRITAAAGQHPHVAVVDGLHVMLYDPSQYTTFDQQRADLRRARALAGERFMFIFSNELNDRMASVVRHKLGLSTADRVSARSCTVDWVSKAVADQFYTAHHLQGKCNASIHLALGLGDRTVACASFAPSTACRSSAGRWTLMRYATSCVVRGGAGRLLAGFRQRYQGDVISYSDERYSDGGLYRSLGFEQIDQYAEDYVYYDHGKYVNKSRCQKRHLEKRLGEPAGSRTEYELADCLGLVRVCVPGKRTWLLPDFRFQNTTVN